MTPTLRRRPTRRRRRGPRRRESACGGRRTNRSSAKPRFPAHDPESPVGHRRLHLLPRRATLPGASDLRVGLSEGEGRDQLSRPRRGGKRGSSWVGRGDDGEEGESPPGRRIGHTKRLSMFGSGGGVSDGDAVTPKRPFLPQRQGDYLWRAEVASKLKNTLKLLRQRKEERFDYYKSAELMAELRAGAPAVLMLASMIQRDEHGNKRIPVLLEQLRLQISDSTPVQEGDSERHWLFTIELEYGSGPSRMKWTVKRTIRDILNMHWKYKLVLRNDKYLRNVHLGTRPEATSVPHLGLPIRQRT